MSDEEDDTQSQVATIRAHIDELTTERDAKIQDAKDPGKRADAEERIKVLEKKLASSKQSLAYFLDDESAEEEMALLTESVNAIQSELFTRQMWKETLESKLREEERRLREDRPSRSWSEEEEEEEVDDMDREQQESIAFQPRELNTLNKKMLATYMATRSDQIKRLLSDANGEATNSAQRQERDDVFVNVRCGEEDDYCIRLKLPDGVTFGEVCESAKNFFGIPKHVEVVLRDQYGSYFSDSANMKNDFTHLPEQNIYLVHVHKPTLEELQQYQLGDMQDVHTGGLSRRKRDESRGLRVIRKLISDLPKSVLIFLIMLLWTFSGDVPVETARFNSKVHSLLSRPRFGSNGAYDLSHVSNLDLIWDYLQGPLPDALFSKSGTTGAVGVIEDSSYVLGSVRLRQARVLKNTCDSRVGLPGGDNQCYGEYAGRSHGLLSTTDKGASEYWGHPACNTTSMTDAAKRARPAFTQYIDSSITASTGWITNTDADYVNGALAWYDPEGWWVQVGLDDRTEFDASIRSLQSCHWIDHATRVVFVELNFFNPSMNMYQSGHVRFEIEPSGLVLPRVFFEGMRLDIISQTRDQLSYALEFLILVWSIYQMIRWRSDIAATKEETGSSVSWLTNVWTLSEVFTVLIFLIAMTFRLFYLFNFHRFVLLNTDRTHDEKDPLLTTNFVFLGTMAYRYTQNNLWMVLATFFASTKLLKYMKIGEGTRILVDTMRYAVTPMLVFMSLFLLTLSGFVLFFHNVYGTRVETFSTVMLSTRALLTSMVSHLVSETHHFDHLAELPWSTNPLHPLMFILFVLICHFVLLNMFLAIMNDSHKMAHAIAKRSKGEYPPLTTHLFVGGFCGKWAARKCGDTTHFDDDSDEDEDENGEDDWYRQQEEDDMLVKDSEGMSKGEAAAEKEEQKWERAAGAVKE